MAWGIKKEKELTIEERLEKALVPVEEQPYSVPENWCWTYIKFAYEVTSSKRVHKKDWLSEGIPFYRTRELVKLSNQGYVDNELFISDELYRTFKAAYGVPQIGDLLISGVGTIGVPYIIESENPFYFKDGNVIWLKSKRLLNPKYTYYLYKSNYIDNMIHSISSGTTVDTYTIVNANVTPIPLPPVAEQQRVVDRIESLFAKLDEAKEKAQAVVDGFETRKAAILHKAFTGELTAKWRKENNLEFNTWENVPFDECILKMQNGLAKRNGTNGTLYVVLRLANLSEDGFNTEDLREIVLDEKEQLSYALKPNDVIMIRVNGSKDNVGRQFLITTQKNWAFCDHIIRIVYKENIQPKFMIYFSKSEKYRFYIKENMVSSAGQNTISRKGMSKMIVPIPSLFEQKEIVSMLDNFINKEQQVKEAAETVLDKIETMKKSILARAFRGELGTNDPAEESAVELLKNTLI